MDYRKDILLQVLEYMEKNIIEGLSVEKVSIISGYSKWHLQRLFKHYFGITLGTYIRHRKLSRSAVLLKQHQGNILDVALASGFASQQCYTRAFKRFFGETPNSFRNSRGWDFSTQIPPYGTDKKPYFYHTVMPDDIELLKQYKALIFHSIRKYRDAGDITQTNEKWLSKHGKAYRAENNRAGKWHSNGKEQEVFHSVFNFYIPRGKYIVIPFMGELSEYIDFFADIYDAYLPAINVKVRESFFIELYRHENLHSRVVNVDILIPVA
ncbi:TPA: helix-turn-helix domain-containing protein [Serratia marcescens]|jgi:Transcriptional regulator containing an amidase domain and an AraC-type DNA-binding HTH domain|uniref:helix-turn-helix domain-containing protein n=1 Tax=Serratia TaxID=613 RepID=UPI00074520F9|nr:MULTISPECIES: helix-turn-helix domain-containing protein [Serratia]AVD64118.1 transcriptional regulator [Serratia marcescens]ELH4208437.1 helix-turn-helix domain-containing protein [Serratia marcescens]ELH4240767.1 helix-turn-helix domain-containing protein [Serratia marcescens]ELH4245474.1 helix-turn-helix domain-containing protein [Serratia marcescens]ELI8837063.1 helix-turn-helix domain-containing protein [Serratia marcescens]